VPMATTENVAVCPAVTVWLTGWTAIGERSLTCSFIGTPVLQK